MMLRYYGHDLLPDVLNEIYKSKGVFDQGNLINFYKAADVFGDITVDEYYNCYDIPCDLKKINDYLEAKKPVIALVDFEPRPGVQTHFVIIHGYNDDKKEDLLCIDPWTGEEQWFHTKYGDPARYIFGLRLYNGPVPKEENVEDKIKDLEDKVKSLNEALASARLEINQERGLKEDAERTRDEYKKERDEARDQRDQALAEKEQAKKKIAGLEKTIKDLRQINQEQAEDIKRLEFINAEEVKKRNSWIKRLLLRLLRRG